MTRRCWRMVVCLPVLTGAPGQAAAFIERNVKLIRDGLDCDTLGGAPQMPGRQFVWPVKCAVAERIAWLNAAYHDFSVQQGAGYSGRYTGGLDERTHGTCSNAYITTELLAGHPAMVVSAFNRDVVRKYWLLARPDAGFGPVSHGFGELRSRQGMCSLNTASTRPPE